MEVTFTAVSHLETNNHIYYKVIFSSRMSQNQVGLMEYGEVTGVYFEKTRADYVEKL